MSDRALFIGISVLLLAVMCALLFTAVLWVPQRVAALEVRLTNLEGLNAKLAVIHDRLADLGGVDKSGQNPSNLSAPVVRIDASVDVLVKKTVAMESAVAELKDRAAGRSDLDKLAGQITRMESKIAEAASKSDPKVAELAAQVAELRTLVEATRNAIRDAAKDVKQLQLEVQKIRQAP